VLWPKLKRQHVTRKSSWEWQVIWCTEGQLKRAVVAPSLEAAADNCLPETRSCCALPFCFSNSLSFPATPTADKHHLSAQRCSQNSRQLNLSFVFFFPLLLNSMNYWIQSPKARLIFYFLSPLLPFLTWTAQQKGLILSLSINLKSNSITIERLPCYPVWALRHSEIEFAAVFVLALLPVSLGDLLMWSKLCILVPESFQQKNSTIQQSHLLECTAPSFLL